ncbi:MAG TPA: DeoR family transcriptional regulator [Acetobacteraceae bacterium]|nr:DeoR family transcriptional regulator [Acetobacteraceae bacterium]
MIIGSPLGSPAGNRSAVLQRRLKIAEWIRRHGQMRVDELSEALAVSAVTIRADLNYLEEQGLIVRSFGKAIAAKGVHARERAPTAPLAKAQAMPMLRLASRVVEADQTLLVGHGELPAQIIPLLAEIPGLTVVLASLDAIPLARLLLDGRVHVLGGEIGADASSLEGSLALRSLELIPLTHFILQAEMLSSDGNLLLRSKPAERFCTAASRRAARRIALIERASLSLEKRPSEIPLSLLTDVIFPTPPSASAREVLAAAGFHLAGEEEGAAAHFSCFHTQPEPAS